MNEPQKKRTLLIDCDEGEVVVHRGMEYIVGPVKNAEIVLYGVTRRSIIHLPGTAVVLR